MNQVMIIEDDKALREALIDTLDLAEYQCLAYESAESAISDLGTVEVGLIISDVNLTGISGHDFLAVAKQKVPNVPVLLMTAFGSIKQAVDALQAGAADYLIKPFDSDHFVTKVRQYIRVTPTEKIKPVAHDARSKQLLSLALRVANADATVMISGPSGAGKEVLARYIHENSPRCKQPFVAINCAAIPENMLEATLFGYEKGAFTGAQQASMGKFELAQNGTLLLDEISEMALPLQAKLLRVLQEREVERLGGKKPIKLSLRVIATSNRDMQQEVMRGTFREDLYYRLNVFPLHWLPLRERADDILPLAHHLLSRHIEESGGALPEFSPSALAALKAHSWPGNAREMSNVIQRALILQNDGVIQEEDLNLQQHVNGVGLTDTQPVRHQPPRDLNEDLKVREYEKIMQVLKQTQGNRTKAAAELGISPRTLRYKMARMRELGIMV
jgi:two-component system response regulator FlrC